jgi:hypothetical protein
MENCIGWQRLRVFAASVIALASMGTAIML